MPVWRLQLSWQVDTVAPRDQMVITPHFDDHGVTTDPQNLCEDLVAAVNGIKLHAGELRCKAYDAQGSVPVYPQGDFVVNKGLTSTWSTPREMAVCLSFYATRNIPRHRGRLYIPAWFAGASTAQQRPTLPLVNMGALADAFQQLGGPDVDWAVYSRKDDRAYPVTNWWVDNEWDVMRSRGSVSTQRTLGTTSEASSAAVEQPLS